MPIAFPSPSVNGFSNFGQGTPKVVAVGISSTTLLVSNEGRLYAQINNNSGQAIWVSKGIPAVVGRGTRLNPGSVLTFTDNELYLGKLSAITQGSPVNIDVEEGV